MRSLRKPRQRSRLLAAQGGFALPTAIIVTFIVILLTGAAIAVSVQSSTSSTRDNSVKAELEAAEAGLQVATYRLNALEPNESQCIGESKAETVEEKCKDSSESLGNGASFKYWTTLPLKAGAKCAGRTVETETGYVQRCVTAEGKVNGVEPAVRLQLRLRAKAGEALLPVPGITGLEEFTASGGTITGGVAASNQLIKISGGAELNKGYTLGPKGKFVQEGGAKHNPPENKLTEDMVANVPASHPTAENNEDSRIGKEDEFFTEGKAANKFSGSPNYELKLSSNAKLVLGGSKYYLCDFYAERNSVLQIASGAKVEIFIDSPENPASKCPAGTGKFEGTGAFKLENLSKDPSTLIISMYGKGPFVLEHGAEAVQSTVIAPKAEVILTGGTTLTGAVVGAKVHLERGFSFAWDDKDSALTSAAAREYERQAWEQCTRGSGASEGC